MLALVGAIAILVLACVSHELTRNSIRARFDKLQVGMTKNTVETIMGVLGGNYFTGGFFGKPSHSSISAKECITVGDVVRIESKTWSFDEDVGAFFDENKL